MTHEYVMVLTTLPADADGTSFARGLVEERLAACLYQAPAELVGTIEMGTAEAVAQALRGAGLEVEVVGMDEDFAPGGPDYDVALVLRTFDRLGIPVVAGFSTHPHWDHLLWHPRFGDVPRYATAAKPVVAG